MSATVGVVHRSDPFEAGSPRTAQTAAGCSLEKAINRRTGTPSTTGWRTATAAAGVSGLRLHDLQHFYASGLIASGCDVVTVQRALGHSSATTTLSTYSHLWPSAEDRTRAAAQALLAESCGPEADRSSTGDR